MGPEARVRRPNLGFDEIEVGVTELDPTSLLLCADDEFDVTEIKRMSEVLNKTQSYVRTILDAKMTVEGSEIKTNRKRWNFYVDLG